jgi:hypothetical protein
LTTTTLTTSRILSFKSLPRGGSRNLGRAPRASTIDTHRALNRIFDEALMHGYISKTQLPVLQNKGHDGERIDKKI